jgi:putative transposase
VRTEAVSERNRPVSGNADNIAKVRDLCLAERHRSYGYRRIHALLKHSGTNLNRKSVLKIMRDQGLTQPKIWRRPLRPKRVEKMAPAEPDRGWQIDMTSFQLSSLRTLFLVLVIDCCTREIKGWTLSQRCRANEWIAAVRQALEASGIDDKERALRLTLRSDNGAQPCSKKFVEFLSSRGVTGQYTGYDAPDDNAYVERMMRTIKEEEIWPNSFDTLWEAHEAIEKYIEYYNNQRPHSALGYSTPAEAAAKTVTLNAA